jgi:hypothetical protein
MPYLWHGNTGKALEQLRWLAEDLYCWDYGEDDEGEPKPQAGSDGREGGENAEVRPGT